MRLFGRKAPAGDHDAAAAAPVGLADPPRDDFPDDEQTVLAEISRLREINLAQPQLTTERELLHLRNLAGIRRLRGAGDAGFAEPEAGMLPAAQGLPELTAAQLTPGLLRAAILRDGCALVRGLIGREPALRFAHGIDRSFAAREQRDAGHPHDAGYYDEFTPDPRVGDELERGWIKLGGGVLGVDSPALNFQMMELFANAGLPELVAGYLGEPPLVTAQKTTLRKAEPAVPGGWHQDGKFMGPVRALNLWLSLSRCGDVAPGLDIVPRRLDQLVTTQTDEAMLDYMVSQRVAVQVAADTPIQRPIFEPGDALLFDELFLHKTGSDPGMPESRYAIENWFFGGSGFPADYVPLAV